ncbi:MAG: hypothetical protein GY906_05990 [bacterium]|nr:hypothetical protein [bacterium]
MPPRSKRVKMLEGMCRALSDRLHDRVEDVARERGRIRPPSDTSSIYTMAANEAPALLDELIKVHQLACLERGELPPEAPAKGSDAERKRMLSAVRATVYRSRVRTV